MERAIAEKFASYPAHISPLLLNLRQLILDQSSRLTTPIDEALKWGVPSYASKTGSPMRIDWSAKSPDYYGLYFHCQTKLISTFRTLYQETLLFQGNRAILLPILPFFASSMPVPENSAHPNNKRYQPLSDPNVHSAVCHCIELALTYKLIRANL